MRGCCATPISMWRWPSRSTRSPQAPRSVPSNVGCLRLSPLPPACCWSSHHRPTSPGSGRFDPHRRTARPVPAGGTGHHTRSRNGGDHPPGQIRRYSFTGTTLTRPTPRMLRAPVVDAGALTVDGIDVDAPSGRGADVDAALVEGGDPAGWPRWESDGWSSKAGISPLNSESSLGNANTTTSTVYGFPATSPPPEQAASSALPPGPFHLLWFAALSQAWCSRRRGRRSRRRWTTRSSRRPYAGRCRRGVGSRRIVDEFSCGTDEFHRDRRRADPSRRW